MTLAILHFLLLLQFVFSSDRGLDWGPLEPEVKGKPIVCVSLVG